MTRLLLVDDEPLLHLALREQLASHGWSVVSAYTCAEARRLAATECYEAALIDLHLPDGDGRELAALLRRHATASLICGWSGEPEPAEQATEVGFDRMLPKPLDTAALRSLLGIRSSASEPPIAEAEGLGTERPLLDDQAALAQAAGHAAIATRLRQQWLAELEGEWGEQSATSTEQPRDAATDRALHRLQAAARLCGAPRLAADTERLRRGRLAWAAWVDTLRRTRTALRARIGEDR